MHFIGRLLIIIAFVSCNDDQTLPNGYIEITQEGASTFIMKGYENIQQGFVSFQPDGFSSSIFIKDKAFYGMNYTFTNASDSSTDIPFEGSWAEQASIYENETYWARYKTSNFYRFIWIRVAYIMCNEVGIEYVISNETKNTPNSNANTQENALGFEIPKLNSNYAYAAHYVEVEGKQVMNLAVEWVANKKHANWVAFFI